MKFGQWRLLALLTLRFLKIWIWESSNMVDGRHFKTVKSLYLGNGSSDRREIW